MAGLNRNQWPLWIGISGRFASECARTRRKYGYSDLAARGWHTNRHSETVSDKGFVENAGTATGTQLRRKDFKKRTSDSDESAGKPAKSPSIKKIVFDRCREYLVNEGMSDERARKMLGKWNRDFGEEAVLATLEAAIKNEPVDPIPWITKGLKASVKTNPENQPRADSAEALEAQGIEI